MAACTSWLFAALLVGMVDVNAPLPPVLLPLQLRLRLAGGLVEKLDPKLPLRSEREAVELPEEMLDGERVLVVIDLAKAELEAFLASRFVSTDTNEYHMLYTDLEVFREPFIHAGGTETGGIRTGVLAKPTSLSGGVSEQRCASASLRTWGSLNCIKNPVGFFALTPRGVRKLGSPQLNIVAGNVGKRRFGFSLAKARTRRGAKKPTLL